MKIYVVFCCCRGADQVDTIYFNKDKAAKEINLKNTNPNDKSDGYYLAELETKDEPNT